jgi:hypothetical protein
MKTQAVKLQLPQSSFINTDGDFDNGIVHMNMGISIRLSGGQVTPAV